MNNFTRKALALASAAGLACTALTSDPVKPAKTKTTVAAAAVDDCNDDWLHAEGSRLYDMNGNEVWLTGANWFGFNCSENCPHYLWAADADDCLTEIADRGINIIRFPIATELIVSWMNGTPNEVNSFSCNADPAYYINADFCQEDGKTPVDSMQVFDIMMKKCKEHGIKAFIDIHSPHTDNSGHNYNLWYGKAGVTTDVWIDSLVWLADKYKNDDTLIGYDLKNEPHGKGQEGAAAAKWDGSTDENNWAYAATKCAEAILDVNPHALILVEGVEQSLSGAAEGDYWGMPDRVVMHEGDIPSPYIGAWWGGNFRGARDYPIVPKQGTSQIVYSPHDYGPSVYAQTWFDKDFNEQTLLDDYWYDTWAYINAENIGPELIGEWGGHMEGANLKWMLLLRDYMIKHHINHTFWCLNTNSGDTGGLWDSLGFTQGSGTSIKWNEPKYEMFEEALWQTKSGKYIGLDHQKALGANGISLNEYYSKYAASEGSNLDGGKTSSGDPVVVTPKTTTTAPAKVTTTTTKPVTTTAPITSVTASVTTAARVTDETLPPVTTGDVYDWVPQLEYDKTPMTVGETRTVKFFKGDEPTSDVRISDVSDDLEVTFKEGDTFATVKALNPSANASFFVSAKSLGFVGAKASFVIAEPFIPTLSGDADCDGKVLMNDVVLIMQSLSNPDRYGLDGSESSAITASGKENADCFDPGTGVTSKDALAVQKYLLRVYTTLPAYSENNPPSNG